METKKKQYIYAVIGAILVIVAVSIIVRMQQGNASPFAGPGLFTIIDDANTVVMAETTDLDPAVRVSYEDRITGLVEQIAGADPATEEVDVYYSNLALFYRYLGDYGHAYQAYLDSLAIEPKNRITWVNLADTLIYMRAYQSAEAAYRKAIEINPGALDTYHKLAQLYTQQYPDNLDKAKQTYQDGLDIAFGSDDGYISHFAEWLAQHGYAKDAIGQYQKLKQLRPESADIIQREIDRLSAAQ